MRINLVYFLERKKKGTQPKFYREISEVYDIATSGELEQIYKRARKWCNSENCSDWYPEGPLQILEKPVWDWMVRFGEDEKNIDAMLLLQIFEIVEDVLKFWEKNGRQAKKYEV